MSKLVNITACTHLAEVNSSFAVMVSEASLNCSWFVILNLTCLSAQAEVLKERVGTESFIVTVWSSPNLNMLPKVHLTSNVVSQFVCTLLQEDPIKLGIKMESTVLAVLAPQNGKFFLVHCYFLIINTVLLSAFSVLSMSYTDRKLATKQGIWSGLNESLGIDFCHLDL